MQTHSPLSTATVPVAGAPPASQQSLWTIDDFALRLKISTRHLRRLIDAGRAPTPIRLGVLLRFDPVVAEEWIASGCRDVRHGGRRHA